MTPHGSGCQGMVLRDGSGPVHPLPPSSRRLAHRIILRIIPPELLLPVISKLDPPANCISKLASFGLRHQLVRRVIPPSARRGSLVLVFSLHLSFSLSLFLVYFQRSRLSGALSFFTGFLAWRIDNPDSLRPDRITMSLDRFDQPDILTSRAVSFAQIEMRSVLRVALQCSISEGPQARATTPPSARLRNPGFIEANLVHSNITQRTQ